MRLMLKELDIYYGYGQDSSRTFINQINNTVTSIGDTTLAYLLAHPTRASQVAKRQQFIQALINDEDLFNQIETILKQIKNAESGFFSFWTPADHVTQEFFTKLYWTYFADTFNKSSVALETHVRMDNFGTAFNSGAALPVSIGVGMGLQLAGTYFAAKLSGYNGGFNQFASSQLSEIKQGVSEIYSRGKILYADPNTRPLVYIGGGVVAAYAAFLLRIASQAKVAIGHAKETRDAINHLQTRLIDVATIVERLQAIANYFRPKCPIKKWLDNSWHRSSFFRYTC